MQTKKQKREKVLFVLEKELKVLEDEHKNYVRENHRDRFGEYFPLSKRHSFVKEQISNIKLNLKRFVKGEF